MRLLRLGLRYALQDFIVNGSIQMPKLPACSRFYGDTKILKITIGRSAAESTPTEESLNIICEYTAEKSIFNGMVITLVHVTALEVIATAWRVLIYALE